MNSAIIYDQSGEIAMIVHPDFESQLDDPAFNPPGSIQIRVPTDQYQATKSYRDLLALTRPLMKDASIADQIGLKILTIDLADVEIITTKTLPVPQAVIQAQDILIAQSERFQADLALDKTLDFLTWAAKQDAVNAPDVAAAQAIVDEQAVIVDQAIADAKAAYDIQFAADPIAARASLDAQIATADIP